MEITALLIARSIVSHPPETTVNGILRFIPVSHLPLKVDLAAFLYLVAYPHEYDREFKLTLVVLDEDGKELDRYDHNLFWHKVDRPVDYYPSMFNLHITFEREGVHAFCAYINDRQEFVAPMEVALWS